MERRPLPAELVDLAEEAAACRACDLWRGATQTVFGRGSADASLFLIGEQPGNSEDLEGVPFVGPAGRVLHEAMAEAGVAERDIYVTNAVKHFKWKPRGERRLHQRPNQSEIAACRPWLLAELEVVRPAAIVVLGGTAGKTLFGASFQVGRARAETLEFEGHPVVVTYHPSAILRAEGEQRDELRSALTEDLRRAASMGARTAGTPVDGPGRRSPR